MAFFLMIASVVYVLDFLTKTVIRRVLALGTEIPVFPFFSIVHVQNTGVAFGFFQHRNALLIGAGLLMAAVIVSWAVRVANRDRWLSVALALVMGGALGNLTDRIVFGRVTDFLDVFVASYHWPAFNVADSAICVGATLLLWKGLIKRGD